MSSLHKSEWEDSVYELVFFSNSHTFCMVETNSNQNKTKLFYYSYLEGQLELLHEESIEDKVEVFKAN